jgi:hypothetical protein
VPTAKAAPEGAGDIWTWVGIDADTKLVASWYVGNRDSEAAMTFMDDLAPAPCLPKLWEMADLVKVLEEWEQSVS